MNRSRTLSTRVDAQPQCAHRLESLRPHGCVHVARARNHALHERCKSAARRSRPNARLGSYANSCCVKTDAHAALTESRSWFRAMIAATRTFHAPSCGADRSSRLLHDCVKRLKLLDSGFAAHPNRA